MVGKCCRDPNYVDPWPTGNLPTNYSGGFDEQGFPTFLNIAKVPPPKKPVTQPPVKTIPKLPIKTPPPVHEQVQPTNVVSLVPDNSDIIPIPTKIPIVSSSTSAPFTKNPYDAVFNNHPDAISDLPNNPCGMRNYVSIRRSESFHKVLAIMSQRTILIFGLFYVDDKTFL